MTYATATKLCFAGFGALTLLALYCFAGAVMNGSFAVAGAIDVDRFHRNAAVFFWLSVASALAALACLVSGITRRWRMSRRLRAAAAQQAVEAVGRASS
jgi:hypothetical protein